MNRDCGGRAWAPPSALRTIAYIEERCREPVTLEDLTEISGLGRFQLIRLCSRLCGLTPMDYVRARRLAGSIPQLLRGDRIIDIALDWGFEYEQSYIRAFRRAYGITPARFRRQEQPVPIVDVPRLEGFTVSASGMLGRPTVLARPALSLYGTCELCGQPAGRHPSRGITARGPLHRGVRPHRAACSSAPMSDQLGARTAGPGGALAGGWAQFQCRLPPGREGRGARNHSWW